MAVAMVRFFGREQGGRHSPPQSGFRPQVDIRGNHTSCLIESMEGKLELAFEREHRVRLSSTFPAQYPNAFRMGDVVEFYEGNRRIGRGRIVDV
jgi:hypothetical protein